MEFDVSDGLFDTATAGQTGGNDGDDGQAAEDCSEADWPFTWADVQTTLRVLQSLKDQPDLFIKSAKLHSTGLQWMINRDRLYNRQHKAVWDKIEKRSNKQKAQSIKQADSAKLKQTLLRRQREQALQILLEVGEGDDVTGLICNDTAEETTAEGVVAAAAPFTALLSSDATTTAATSSSTATASKSPIASAGAERQPAANKIECLDTTNAEEGETVAVDAEGGDGVNLDTIQKCHVCKHAYKQLHFFYFAMCPPCADLNWLKRNQTADLRGRTVLLTGSRMKIGQQICLLLLRNGATVIATTRFAVDMAQRYSQMEDYPEWKDRLHIYRLDLRNLWLVREFCTFLKSKYSTLYAIVNNAAQTVARPPIYYSGLIEKEVSATKITQTVGEHLPLVDYQWDTFVQNTAGIIYNDATLFPPCNAISHRGESVPWATDDGTNNTCRLTEMPPEAMTEEVNGQKSQTFPAATTSSATTLTVAAAGPIAADSLAELLKKDREWFDMHDTRRTALDKRTENSWTQTLEEVSGEEAAEVHAINALAPFIINSQLKPLLDKLGPGEDPATRKRFIINVSAMEAQFYRFKTDKHPHTNMAKAAANMMTRTSAQGYAKDRIFMNSVDTGWITDENPQHKQLDRHSKGLLCPLDEVDAAARVLDLIFVESEEFGKFWKNYRVVPW